MPRAALPGALATLALLLGSTGPLPGAELQGFPARVRLDRPGATQQVVVVEAEAGRVVADRAAGVTYTSSAPAVAVVSESGVVTGVGDGEAVVTAAAGGRSVKIPVSVQNANAARAPGFVTELQPILTRVGCNSGACHGALAGKGGLKLSLRGYDPAADHFALTRQAGARRVDAADPGASLLLLKSTRAIPHGGGARFEDDTPAYAILRDWIAAGAPGPDRPEPALTHLEVLPPAARLAPGATQRLVVQATYADGSSRDVTAWAKFTSSDDPVAAVSEAGVVTVAGPGEAGVAALFGSRVASHRVTAPFPARRSAPAARVPVNNLVDRHVQAKWAALNLAPSAICSDETFIRRASLDACGVLPKPAEVAAFLADTSADKRVKLVDSLLSRPEYVDYWAHKWSDLLLVSSRKLPAPAMWAFYRAVRQSVADNQPWDRFARDLLTAQGSTFEQGLSNYFVLHKDVPELAEATAVTFLGLSVNCCRCHNHPLEKWTQDQYWGQANLFARVGLKNGGQPGEVVVQALPAGDAPHPRTGLPAPPTPLDGAPGDLVSSRDRRADYADWLTAPGNPYFARSLANRVWKNFLGRGLVEAEDDLRETNPASNPELLDALAAEFRATGFDVKKLARLIMTSSTYQLSATPHPGNAADDRYYSRYLVRRLSAEVILDAYADLTGVPTPFTQVSLGPTGGLAGASYPAGTRAVQLPDSQLVSRFLDAFGRAERSQTCACERNADSSVGQALHLNNGQTLNDKLRDSKSRLSQWLAAGTPDAQVLDELFRAALGRPPGERERQRFLAVLAEAPAGPGRREALEDMVWAVVTGKEFLFNH